MRAQQVGQVKEEGGNERGGERCRRTAGGCVQKVHRPAECNSVLLCPVVRRQIPLVDRNCERELLLAPPTRELAKHVAAGRSPLELRGCLTRYLPSHALQQLAGHLEPPQAVEVPRCVLCQALLVQPERFEQPKTPTGWVEVGAGGGEWVSRWVGGPSLPRLLLLCPPPPPPTLPFTLLNVVCTALPVAFTPALPTTAVTAAAAVAPPPVHLPPECVGNVEQTICGVLHGRRIDKENDGPAAVWWRHPEQPAISLPATPATPSEARSPKRPPELLLSRPSRRLALRRRVYPPENRRRPQDYGEIGRETGTSRARRMLSSFVE